MTLSCRPSWLIREETVWTLRVWYVQFRYELTGNSLELTLSYPLKIWTKQISHRWLCRKCQASECLGFPSWFSKQSYQKETTVDQVGSSERPTLERVILLHKWVSHLIAGTCICSAFNLLWDVTLGEIHEKKASLHRYLVGNGRGILIVSLGGCGHFSLILNQKSVSASCPKVQCKSEIWASSERYYRTGKPSVLKFKVFQRVRHDLETEQQ